jgi:hypothetical protein
MIGGGLQLQAVEHGDEQSGQLFGIELGSELASELVARNRVGEE